MRTTDSKNILQIAEKMNAALTRLGDARNDFTNPDDVTLIRDQQQTLRVAFAEMSAPLEAKKLAQSESSQQLAELTSRRDELIARRDALIAAHSARVSPTQLHSDGLKEEDEDGSSEEAEPMGAPVDPIILIELARIERECDVARHSLDALNAEIRGLENDPVYVDISAVVGRMDVYQSRQDEPVLTEVKHAKKDANFYKLLRTERQFKKQIEFMKPYHERENEIKSVLSFIGWSALLDIARRLQNNVEKVKDGLNRYKFDDEFERKAHLEVFKDLSAKLSEMISDIDKKLKNADIIEGVQSIPGMKVIEVENGKLTSLLNETQTPSKSVLKKTGSIRVRESGLVLGADKEALLCVFDLPKTKSGVSQEFKMVQTEGRADFYYDEGALSALEDKNQAALFVAQLVDHFRIAHAVSPDQAVIIDATMDETLARNIVAYCAFRGYVCDTTELDGEVQKRLVTNKPQFGFMTKGRLDSAKQRLYSGKTRDMVKELDKDKKKLDELIEPPKRSPRQ